MIKIYHNPRCKKSRAGLQHLQEKNIEFTIVQYLKDEPFTEESLKSVFKKMDVKPNDMIRTQEKEYKANYKGKTFSDDDLIKIMVKNPKFINRPIIETDDRAVWGDPPSNIDNIL
ncbi:MAG: arsenate reductase (glutaredoxin) [Bacteroidales bacterium]|nr:arsenate reductase (glutaredoxin) [Bacteroidales bacterium]